jgi:type IV secretory pathway VirB2 component (pilin)
MRLDLTLTGAILLSTCIIAGGILTGAQMFAVDVPFAPYIMVILAALVVLGAAMLVLSSRGARAADPSRR